MNQKEVSELKQNLAMFSGTTQYHQLSIVPLKCTDGVRYLAEQAQCFWLIDAIAGCQVDARIASMPFQVWELAVKKNKSATLRMSEEQGKPYVISQGIEYTDFPLDRIMLWLVEGVLMLPNEY